MKTRHNLLRKLLILLVLSIFLFAAICTSTPTPQLVQAQIGSTPYYIPKLMKAPPPTTSYYMNKSDISNYNPWNLGYEDARIDYIYGKYGYNLLAILDFGQPCKTYSQEYGAYAFDPYSCHSINDIQSDVKLYIQGFCNSMASISGNTCGYSFSNSPILSLAVGTNNCTNGAPKCEHPELGNNVTFQHGQAWGQMIGYLNSWLYTQGYTYQIGVVGANDMEQAWNNASNTSDWVTGYNYATTSQLYNFGTCENCLYLTNDPGPLGWSIPIVYYISFGAIDNYAIPEIYLRNGIHAYQWRYASEYSSTHPVCGKPTCQINFSGAMTQWQACQQVGGCSILTDQASSQAVPQLAVEISKSTDQNTHNSVWTIKMSSDMKWYPSP